MEMNESREVANLCKSGVKGYNEMNGRVYDTDGVCPTIRANSGGHNEIKIAIPQATKQGYIECELGGVIDMSYPNSKTRRGRVQEGGTVSPTIMANNNELYVLEPVIGAIRGRNPDNPSDRTPGTPTQQRLEIGGDVSNTLTTVQKDNVVVERMPFRVRKLTPKECWRLMGFDDGSFERAEKVNSNSQLYKQAGNSIVVDVLMEIFREMLP